MSENPFYYNRSIGGRTELPQHLVVVDRGRAE